jgi:hypothetical protein
MQGEVSEREGLRYRWFKSGARNHLQANRSLAFRFDLVI